MKNGEGGKEKRKNKKKEKKKFSHFHLRNGRTDRRLSYRIPPPHTVYRRGRENLLVFLVTIVTGTAEAGKYS